MKLRFAIVTLIILALAVPALMLAQASGEPIKVVGT
jgi:hypothetical protein